MLILKPNCELCNIDLAPDSKDARICSYECTFCVDCVESVLENVCPNCGGGFSPRPIRPATAYRTGVSLLDHPASGERVITKLSRDEIKSFSSRLKNIKPECR